jgi:hypothetical protein
MLCQLWILQENHDSPLQSTDRKSPRIWIRIRLRKLDFFRNALAHLVDEHWSRDMLEVNLEADRPNTP